jgi:hypothetical protein
LQENNRGSTVETFRQMIEQSGLDIVFTDGDFPTLTKESSFFYIGMVRRGDTPPEWTASKVERTYDVSRGATVWRRLQNDRAS